MTAPIELQPNWITGRLTVDAEPEVWQMLIDRWNGAKIQDEHGYLLTMSAEQYGDPREGRIYLTVIMSNPVSTGQEASDG